MDVIGFLCVSLGTSTVQFHDSLGSRCECTWSEAGFSSQNGDFAVGVYYRRTTFCCAFLWAKGLNANNINIEIFPLNGGKCLSRKAVHPRWQMFRWWGRGWNGRAEVAETRVKRLLYCGFRRTGKAMRQVYQCLWRTCREICVFFFKFRILRVLRFISICDLFTDSLSLITILYRGNFTLFFWCLLTLKVELSSF
jgi:hypothetical protein